MEHIETVQHLTEPRWLTRKATSIDLPFIYATWLNSYWSDGKRPGVSKTDFFWTGRKLIDRLLLESQTTVAYLPINENVIIGYISFDDNYLNYIYVKEDFRNFGIASDLYDLAQKPKKCTYLTGQAQSILNTTKERLTYNPLFITNLLLHYLEAKEI